MTIEEKIKDKEKNLGDTDSTIAMRFATGDVLVRCNNGAGVPYSYIMDITGHELYSIERKYETAMVEYYGRHEGRCNE